MAQPHTTIPDWLLERVHLGELPPAELADAQRRIDADPDAQARLARLAREDQETLARYPAADIAARIHDKARVAKARDAAQRDGNKGRRSFLLALPALAGAAVLVLAVIDRDAGVLNDDAMSSSEVTRTKGAAQLVITRKRGKEEEQLARGQSAKAGDLLQLGYRAAGAAYGAILSLDGRGNVTQHLPEAAAAAARLDAQGLVTLNRAYELDDAPNFETFFFVYGKEAFALAPVLEAARALRRQGQNAGQESVRLRLPSGLEQTVFVVQKAER